MGLFDTFVDEARMRKCQSKAFGASMETYKVGDEVSALDGLYVTYMPGWLIAIENGRFKGIFRYDELGVTDDTQVFDYFGNKTVLGKEFPLFVVEHFKSALLALMRVFPDVSIPLHEPHGHVDEVVMIINAIEAYYSVLSCREVWKVVKEYERYPVELKWMCNF